MEPRAGHAGRMLASDVPDQLPKVEVERIAALAHLELDEPEKELFARQLAEILAYAEQVQHVDATGVPPTSHVLARHPSDRPDVVRPSLASAEALANAPEPAVAKGFFKVPRVLG